MPLFLADENFNHHIVRGLRKRIPGIDIVRVQEVGLMGLEDPEVLQWAANENRILLTHDVTTMTKHAIDRISEGKLFSGMIEVKQRAAIGQAIDDIELLVKCGSEEDWTGQITYIPLT